MFLNKVISSQGENRHVAEISSTSAKLCNGHEFLFLGIFRFFHFNCNVS